MPLHDWKKVYAGIFHDFHQSWSMAIRDELNAILPADYYALVEQTTNARRDSRFGPDVLTLQHSADDDEDPDGTRDDDRPVSPVGGAVLAPAPKASGFATSDLDFYRRKKNVVVVRHATKDRIVAAIEIVSWGNKSSNRHFEQFIAKTCGLIEKGIHLLIVDPFPTTARDPEGVHSAVWEELEGEPAPLPTGKDRVAVSYECGSDVVQAYVEPLVLGDVLPPMPVFLRPGGCVMLNLEQTYTSAYGRMPARWRRVIEA
jgi:hypothetical protein